MVISQFSVSEMIPPKDGIVRYFGNVRTVKIRACWRHHKVGQEL
jgi:hypothetical protein